MAVTSIRIRRRATGGSVGAPASLKTAELAYNMADGIFYVGYGDDGGGNATSVKAFAKDNFVDPSGVYQPLDADLTAFAALDATAGLITKTAANTYVRRTITGTATRISVTQGDGAAGNPTIDLATVTVGSSTGGGSTKFTVDGYGRITNASQASLTDLSAPTADFSVGGFKLTSVATPTSGTDAVNKNYVDNLFAGLDDKGSVRAATTAALPSVTAATQTLTATANGALAAQDGVTLVANDLLLVKNQAAPAQNGIYTVTQVGTGGTPFILTRVSNMDTWAEVPGAQTVVEEGTTLADSMWVATANQGGTLGTTSITWARIDAGAGGGFTVAGAGLTSTGSTVDVGAGTGIAVNADSIQLTGQALALHSVATAADQLIYATGSGAFTTTGFTSVARTLVSQTTQALMRSTGLGLGTIATQDANNVAITGGTIDNVTIDGGTF